MAGRVLLGDLRQVVAGFVATGAGSGALLAYQGSLSGKHDLNSFQAWLALVPAWLVVTGCFVIGIVIYFALHALTSRGEDQTNEVRATAKNRSQSAVTMGPNSPIHQHMGPEEPPQRNLTGQQISALRAALKKAPPTTVVVYRLPSKESQKYVIQFSEVLKECGWEVLDLIGISQPFPDEIIRVAWRNEKSLAYSAFVAGLINAGITFSEDECVSDSDPRIKVIFDVGRAKMDDFQAAADRIHF